ncbi:GGDEF domain-containing protein [Cryptosporangium sp. NPDC051539]|uniref:GGDEF domain-containing protein n=1 Tax=Cryptosporangium sp. NPDC051539 TaxID=3363962 RepID=UPI0037925802
MSPEDYCADLDQLFRSRDSLTVVVVRDAARRTGLIMRSGFELVMSGRFGYGRALWGRRRVGVMADWTPVILSATDHRRVAPGPDPGPAEPVRRPAGHLAGRSARPGLRGPAVRRAGPPPGRAGHSGRADRPGQPPPLPGRAEHGLRRGDPGGSVAVVLVDLDRMKQVNDTLGHGVGDQLLVSVARRLVATCEPGDVVARLGGDEFAVLRRASAERAAPAYGERLRAAVDATDPWSAGVTRAAVRSGRTSSRPTR